MQKVKSNARWTELSPEKLQILDKWLFEEKLSYAAAFPRAQAELGFKGHISSLKRYFLRRRKERVTEEFKDVRDELVAVNGATADPAALRQASMKLLGTFLFQQLRQSPQNVKEAVSVARLIVQNDYNEVLREVKTEEFDLRRELKGKDHEIRREALEFARDKFQYDMVERAVRALPQLQKLAEAMSDPDPKQYQDNPHWNEARQIMFEPREDGQEGADKPES
jgi:hypothetical protein